MATKFVICGAAGRMGRALAVAVLQTEDAELVGAVEATGHPAIGKDIGELSGIGRIGILINADYRSVADVDTVTLDFSHPTASLEHLRIAVEVGSAIAIGTTGFNAEQEEQLNELATRTRCVIAANMSVGVAVLQRITHAAAVALGAEFDAEIVEMHHRMKVDAPSGTALALARTVADAKNLDFDHDSVYGRHGTVGKRGDREIGVMALRGGGVVGDHTIVFASGTERIELTHRAHSRDCLADGAVRAGLWLMTQPPGRYGMSDVLGFPPQGVR